MSRGKHRKRKLPKHPTRLTGVKGTRKLRPFLTVPVMVAIVFGIIALSYSIKGLKPPTDPDNWDGFTPTIELP